MIALSAAVLALLAAAPARAAEPAPGRDEFLSVTRDVLWLDHADLREDGAWLLRTSGLDVDAVVRALVHVLSDPDADRAVEAAALLGDVGPDARAAVPALVDGVLGAKDPDRRAACAAALGRVAAPGGPASVPLLSALHDEDPFVRRAAAAALGRVAGGSALARRALEKAASDDADERVRLAAGDAAKALGGKR